MDAYDVSQKVKDLYSKHVDRSSGTLGRSYGAMKLCVWTIDGYREIRNASYNEKLN